MLKLIYKKTMELIPYINNTRTHDDKQVNQIASSINEFGFTNPILIDDKNEIIAGHGRLMASQKLNLESVPCIVLSGLSKAQKKAYVIADNRLALNAGWNEELLRIELQDLKDLDFNIDLLGFTDDELKFFDEDIEELIAQTDEDSIPGEPVDLVSVNGDVWLLGKHRLMCGDSTSVDNVEKLMDGHKADMVFTDPPYGVDYDGIKNDSRLGLEKLLDDVFCNYKIFSHAGSPIYVFHSDRCADIFHNVFRKYCHFSSMIIWVKPALVLSQTDYQSQHEPCMYGWIDGGTHKWFSDRKQTSIWNYGKEHFSGHTTPKPVDLVSNAINNSSISGSNVIDLFGGSGSTLIACEKTNRKAFLMELDEKYVDVIIKRWQDFTGKEAVLESSGENFNLLYNKKYVTNKE